MQTLPSLQSSGVPAPQSPAWQVSWPSQRSASAHETPFCTAGYAHVPALHVSDVQGLLSLQTPQLAPFLPQAPAVLPATQAVPFQHPVQHTPPWHLPVPPMQLVLSATLVCAQAPPTHVSVLQSFPSSQFEHTPPAVPHLASAVPGWQALLSQHP